MGKILAIDYGKVRCGIAATDDLKIIASGLDTVPTAEIMCFLNNYLTDNNVETLVIGLPKDLRGNMSEIEVEILKFIESVSINFPQLNVVRFDERYTSKMASYFISQSGKSKKKRQDKGLIDKVSATIILQNYLEKK